MDKLSNELNKLKIDKSKRIAPREGPSLGWILLLGVVFAGVVAGVYVFRPTAGALGVQTIRPRTESSETAVLIATGYVVPHHRIELGTKILGRVEWVGVEKGDSVQAGEVLVLLEAEEYRAQLDRARAVLAAAEARLMELEQGSRPQEIERARAAVDGGEAQLRADEANHRRVEALVNEGVFTPENLDAAVGRRDVSRANLETLRQEYELVQLGPRIEQIDAARAEVERALADVAFAETQMDAVEIRAPISGVVLERIVEPGEMVTTSFVGDRGANSSTVALADLSDLQVELDISQNDFNLILPDHPCVVVTDTYPDDPYDCVVAEIAPEADRQRATIQVKVQVLDPDTRIKPEMNARVTFLNRENPGPTTSGQRLSIPSNAVTEDAMSGSAVFLLVDGAVELRPITVTEERDGLSYVSAGLSGNESVIVGPDLATLVPGDRVESRPE